MIWYAWVMVIFCVLGCAAYVHSIGEKRNPITPNSALWVIVVQLLYIWGIVSLAR